MLIEMIDSASQEATMLEIPALGAPWPGQGGVYAGLVRGEGGRYHHLIVSTDTTGSFEDCEWGEYGQDVIGASSKSDGMANTRAMAEAGSDTAKKVLALEFDGHADWHIGSQADMHVAFANCAELFEKDDWYWTSTQNDRHDAFAQDFANGDSYWRYKDNEFRVRAVRTIQLQPFNA